ncbi:hypothetical protein QAD02_003534, partial [Eretmocerus hayati]
VSLRFFPRGNLRLLLTSPMGTTSTLLFERPRDVLNSNFDDWPFLSVHFWSEETKGRWTLQIVNAGNRHVNSPGILKKWQLIFYGTASNPIKIRRHHYNPSQHLHELQPSSSFKSLTYEEWTQEKEHSAPIFVVDPLGSESSSPNDSQDHPRSYVGAAPLVRTSMSPVDPPSGPLLTNLLPGDVPHSKVNTDSSSTHSIRIISRDNCDPECDSSGCLSQGPFGCLTCRNYQSD